ncbi:hypothetical protein L208DRAFT_1408763 [Tricholoma matsutake]|nr:hypothetical protein L208DRAFT_1408763 [Tricholoma matsutake 945]
MAKKSKSKPHKPPTEKFVVVVDPWRYRNFFEDIGAWFEIMLTDDYPGTRVDMIYGQVGKHHNVIVQLPGHVDIRPLLGAHRHAAILKPPYNMNTDGVSYIFEYNFEREGNPRGSFLHLLVLRNSRLFLQTGLPCRLHTKQSIQAFPYGFRIQFPAQSPRLIGTVSQDTLNSYLQTCGKKMLSHLPN